MAMFGKRFFSRLMLVAPIMPSGKIKNWLIIRVYICPKCGCARIFWVDEMGSSDHICCRAESCNGTMTLMMLTMEQAKTVPQVWARIELASARGF
jgi:hypothetical protein